MGVRLVLPPGVGAKDVVLAMIAKIGAAGGTGHVLEYTGTAMRGLDMEGRMTVCNMSIEAGARAGLVAPDDTTFAWLAGREAAPAGEAWDRALAAWRARTDRFLHGLARRPRCTGITATVTRRRVRGAITLQLLTS